MNICAAVEVKVRKGKAEEGGDVAPGIVMILYSELEQGYQS